MDTAGILAGTVLDSATVGTHSHTVSAWSNGYVTQTYVYPIVIKAAAVVPPVVVPPVVVPPVVVPPVVVPAAASYKTVKATVSFKARSSKLSTAEKRKLRSIAKKYNTKITGGTIVGYVQRDSTRANDNKLSAARARVIAKYLASQGVKVSLVTQGKGVLSSSVSARKSMITLNYSE